MKYLEKSFSSNPANRNYRDNWDRIFLKNILEKEHIFHGKKYAIQALWKILNWKVFGLQEETKVPLEKEIVNWSICKYVIIDDHKISVPFLYYKPKSLDRAIKKFLKLEYD